MLSRVKRISLAGSWEMDYIQDEYTDTRAPELSGCIIKNAVPSYWEDRIPDFSETFLYENLKWNPDYTIQKYPIAGYLPDMTLPTIVGCFIYRKTVSISGIADASEIRLEIGGAHNTLSAWINGHFIDRHAGYSAPFSFEVPKEYLSEGENEVILAVSNLRLKGYKDRPISGCTTRAANNFTGGIYGDCELVLYTGDVRDAWVTVSEDNATFSLHLERKTGIGDVKLRILDGKKAVYERTLGDGEDIAKFDTGALSLWTPDSPKRYTAEIVCSGDVFRHSFGIRRLTAEGTRLKLNGDYIYARGICEHGYYPLTVHPPRDKGYYRRAILRLKELGFNFIRFHTWVPLCEYMEAADELGMLIEVETPNNTTSREWEEIVQHARRFTSPVIYSSGNEMVIDEDYIEHLKKCADTVHSGSDSLFSPMSAMRGIEYHSYGDLMVEEPFPHNPERLAKLAEFCDLYNSYPNGQLSYFHASADPANIDRCNAIYKKPLLSHEICINGTYCDISLEERYKGTRIGETALYSSVRSHLDKKGLLPRAPLYYRNSSEWQRRLRKQCFEAARRSKTLAGYDFLGDIDHHWHTFGYCVGMMNEFYELKPGETVENVRRYNSDLVLLADLPYSVNYECGECVKVPIHASNYATDIRKATLTVTVRDGHKVYLKRLARISDIPSGELKELYELCFNAPRSNNPLSLKLTARLACEDAEYENEWEIYVFPKVNAAPPSPSRLKAAGLAVYEDTDEEGLLRALKSGKNVLMLGAGPFATLGMSFQISLAGRTAGHLATVIEDTPLMESFPHSGFCGWQFRSMLDGATPCVLDIANIPFEPLLEAVSTYKYAHKEALIFEYRVGEAKLLVCTLKLDGCDAGARWLKHRLYEYAMSEDFEPKHTLTEAELRSLFNTNPIYVAENTNLARNTNDLTL